MSDRTKYILIGLAAAVLTALLAVVIIAVFSPDGDAPPSPAPTPSYSPSPTPTPTPSPTTPVVTLPPETHVVTATATAGGSIYPGGMIEVEHGDTLTLLIEADEGFEIGAVTFNGRGVRLLDDYSFSYEIPYITEDHELYVEFVKVEEPEPTPTPEPEPTDEPSPLPTRPPSSNTDID